MTFPIFSSFFAVLGQKRGKILTKKGVQKPEKTRVFQKKTGRVKPGLKTENPGLQPGLDDPWPQSVRSSGHSVW